MILPIADRELRVSARAKATRRLRILFAVGAVTIAGALGLLSAASRGFLTPQMGMMIFSTLKWSGFTLACGAGVFLTSDCLSEEKREGTLGLLFLTDLRGYDVVFGKLFATSLRCFYSLLAVFPVMALSFVLGGVAAVDFRHTQIALCNTLFFSLALGMMVSVVSRDTHKAMTAALTLLLVFLLLTPVVDSYVLGRNANQPAVGLLSPLYAIRNTDDFHASYFWISTIMLHLTGWCFLLTASWLAPVTWHEKGVRGGGRRWWRIPVFDAGLARGRKLMDKNPVCWIISRDRWAPVVAGLATLFISGVFVWSVASYSKAPVAAAVPPVKPPATSTIHTTNSAGTSVTTYNYTSGAIGAIGGSASYRFASSCAGIISLAFEFWLAAHVARFYVDGKRNGLLELLMVTPTRLMDVIRGHWLALRRLFFAPMAALLSLNLALGAIPILISLSMPASTGPGAPTGWWTSNRIGAFQQTVVVLITNLAWVTGLFAIAWVSIWMGLASKKTPVAMLKVFCYVKILPWLGIGFSSALFFFLMTFSFSGVHGGWLIAALIPTVPFALMIGVNCALMRWARYRVGDVYLQWTVSR
jgi:ABC-type transport system involved in cytochrome c biogenesis permease component